MNPVEGFHRSIHRLSTDRGFTARLAVANAIDASSPAELGLRPLRIAILRDMTVEPLVPALRAELAASGFAAEVWVGDFDTIGRDALSSASGLDAADPELIVILRWLEQTAPDLATRFVTLSPEAAADAVAEVADRIESELRAIRGRTTAPIIINTFPAPDLTTLGILDAQLETGHRRTIQDLNREILRVARDLPDVLLVDMDRLVARIGSRAAIDERGWQTSRAPLGTPLIVALAADLARFARALRGSVRKCLVLDCDGTLWGGILGEDGPTGIQLDPGHPGSGYLAFQREILNLRERGVLLTLVSKNDEPLVLDVLRDHPHMLIHEADLAGWRINWRDKATNLAELADELNIGLDSFVFVDDSEFERDLVRSRFPEVAVIDPGTDPSRFATVLSEAGLFDSLAFSADDRARGTMVAADRRRKGAERAAVSLDDYLASLGMEATVGPPSAGEIARVAQLTQKTNQFNLTTIRRTEGDIARLVADPDAAVHALRLKDRFSELGLVGVAIVRYDAGVADVDTLLMSCRVLGRGVEDAFLASIGTAAAARGATMMRGTYSPTARNGQVATFFADRGFTLLESDGNVTRWEADLAERPLAAPEWIVLRRLEEE